jgi:large subunit ribosomal protein L23
MKNDPTEIIKTVIVSEKATRLAELHNQYVFRVHRNAHKPQIKSAIEVLFKTKVVTVRTMKMPEKTRHKNTRIARHIPSWKKAIVKLADGEKIDLA